MAQTALELIYNWRVVEKEGIIVGDDAHKISAANKIRLLLSLIKVPYVIPPGLKNLTAHVAKDPMDGPEIITEIRNAIIHSREVTRKKLDTISPLAKHEALQLCIWYIELAMLNILDYHGEYHNRCSGEMVGLKGIQKVPWATN